MVLFMYGRKRIRCWELILKKPNDIFLSKHHIFLHKDFSSGTTNKFFFETKWNYRMVPLHSPLVSSTILNLNSGPTMSSWVWAWFSPVVPFCFSSIGFVRESIPTLKIIKGADMPKQPGILLSTQDSQ